MQGFTYMFHLIGLRTKWNQYHTKFLIDVIDATNAQASVEVISRSLEQ